MKMLKVTTFIMRCGLQRVVKCWKTPRLLDVYFRKFWQFWTTSKIGLKIELRYYLNCAYLRRSTVLLLADDYQRDLQYFHYNIVSRVTYYTALIRLNGQISFSSSRSRNAAVGLNGSTITGVLLGILAIAVLVVFVIVFAILAIHASKKR